MPTRSNTALLAFVLLAGGSRAFAAAPPPRRSASTPSTRARRRSPTRRSRMPARTSPARCSIWITIATRRSASSPKPSRWRAAKLPFELAALPRRLAVRPAGQAQRDRRGQAAPRSRSTRSSSTTRRAASMPPRRDGLGYAGFSVHYALNLPVYKDDVLAFLGASYFRALGKGQLYGLSARGLAIDTALASGEEFPRFVEFWIERPRRAARRAGVLWPARLAPRDRRVPVRVHARRRVDRRGDGADLPSRQRRQARHRAADQHVLPRLEPARRRRRLPARGARFRRALDPVEHRRVDLAAARQSASACSSRRSRRTSPRGFGLHAARSARFADYQDLSTRYERASERVGRADRRMGPGPRRARADSGAGRDERQHRRVLDLRHRARAEAADRPALPRALAEGRRRRARRPRGSPKRCAARATCPKPDASLGFVDRLRRARCSRALPGDAPLDVDVSADANGTIVGKSVRRNPDTGGARVELHFAASTTPSRSSCVPRCAAARRYRRHGATRSRPAESRRRAGGRLRRLPRVRSRSRATSARDRARVRGRRRRCRAPRCAACTARSRAALSMPHNPALASVRARLALGGVEQPTRRRWSRTIRAAACA